MVIRRYTEQDVEGATGIGDGKGRTLRRKLQGVTRWTLDELVTLASVFGVPAPLLVFGTPEELRAAASARRAS